jgi:hypothetical protein
MLFTHMLQPKFTVCFGPRVNVRDTPSAEGRVISTLNKGAIVEGTLTRSNANWLQLAGGKGYVMIKHEEFGQLLEPTTEDVPAETSAEKQSTLLEQVKGASPAVRLDILRMLMRDASIVETLCATNEP